MSSSATKDSLTSPSEGHHLAAILHSKGSGLVVEHRRTPTPGPNDLFIDVKSIALNPIDWKQRDFGFAIASYPAVIGSDIAGVVISAGSSVAEDAPKPGTRGAPDYGALQKRVLVPAGNATALPDAMSFNEASLLPMAVSTALAGWYSIGMQRETTYIAADKKGLLVWGGASSVGGAAIQSAKLMGFRVYATSSEKHHDYLKTLGASRVFDYKHEDVVEDIIMAAKEDGVTIDIGYDAVGALKSSMEVLKKSKRKGTAKMASAAALTEDSPKVEGVDVKFVLAPADEKERTEFYHFVFTVWLKERLAKNEFIPGPKMQVVEGGLKAAQKGLDELKNGVSGTKLVLEV